jgi:hypothetical protein
MKIIKKILLLSLFLLLSFCISWGSSPQGYTRSSAAYANFSNLNININNLKGFINARYSQDVVDYVNTYTRSKRSAEEFLGRIPVYFPMFEEKLRLAGLPDELKVLAIVESHLNNNVYSHAGAGGIWQFIPGTARHYNLRVNRIIDERFSVEEATDAAIMHLKDLYEIFGDWTFVMAAYNSGAGNVRRAMRLASDGSDYWEVAKYLPRETRNYVPKFIAISYVLNHFTDYDLMPEPVEDHFYDNSQAIVYKHMSFDYISRITGLPVNVIKALNFAYRKSFIPQSTEGYKLILPRAAMLTLLDHENYENIVMDKDLNQNYSRYIRNYFPRKIAKHLLGSNFFYETTLKLDQDIRNRQFEYAAKEIQGPDLPAKAVAIRDEQTDYIVYKLKPGESLLDISKQFDGVSLADMMRWNSFTLTDTPRTGSEIRIRQ